MVEQQVQLVVDFNTREQFEAKLQECETGILQLTGMPLDEFERHWAIFTVDGHENFKARYFIFGQSTKPQN